jgi:hypothetical protein
LAYVVVDEVDAGVAELIVSDWPRLDTAGRLVFDQEADAHLAVDVASLETLLHERVVVEEIDPTADDELRLRPVQAGDVFAARRREGPHGANAAGDAGRWFEPPVVDLSAEAREAAKVQYYAAVSHVLSEAELDAIVSEFRDEGPEGTDPGRGPERGGSPQRPQGPPTPPAGAVEESPDHGPRSPWVPRSLVGLRPDLANLVRERGLVYVVVDELAAGVAELIVSEWPGVDDSGRLIFDLGADRSLAAFAADVQALLEERVPVVQGGAAPAAEESLRRRPLQVGDVFGAVLRETLADDVDTPGELGHWLRAPVVDLTAEAREAAKVQYYAAVSQVLSVTELDAIVDEFGEEEGGPPDTTPEDSGEGGGGPSVPPSVPGGTGGLEAAKEPVVRVQPVARVQEVHAREAGS